MKTRLCLIIFFSCMGFNILFSQNITIVTEDYPPYNYLDESNTVTGFSTEVL